MDDVSVKQIAVLYPVGGVGHIGPMTQLAKAFLHHGYDVTMVLIEPPIKSTDSGAGFIERVAASNPSITFHILPPTPAPDVASSTKHPFLLILELMRQYNDKLESFLRSIPRERLHSLVIDLFCTHAIDVATRLGVPVFKFFASGAGTLAIFTQLPALLAGRLTGLKELGDKPLQFLGVPPMPASHLATSLLESPEDELCRTSMEILERNAGTHGVLVNTFESLEQQALQALRDPLCVPGQALPPVYPIGPLVGTATGRQEGGGGGPRHECLAWLDAQPERSVAFLCWGSKGALPKEQLKETAVGLERCGQRFLWVVRTPAGSDGPGRYWEQRAEADLDALLPEGFVERTKGRGLVVTSWAPQVDVLNHPATGVFVTHCGWNSTLEAIAAGVPMLCWPLAGAEQRMNKVFITEDMGVGMEMEGYVTGLIKAEEIEGKLRLALESEEGTRLKKRALQLKKETEEAMEDGGSSEAAFLRFLSDVANANVRG
ncbi:UDP-glycosyltransferase 88B1 [Zea mays]|uniref:UDP-glycosyltransferase 88B1 n=1 Tax=Zea mays TaxID=4577 RepID=A0A3L6FJH8_MAIZE|nr:UDP-glycosyltransferase 88B1 [Zea mays]